MKGNSHPIFVFLQEESSLSFMIIDQMTISIPETSNGVLPDTMAMA
jgi:hypothetical protein